MKKISLLLLTILFSVSVFSQCNIDTTLLTHPGIYPPVDSFPCIERNVPYTQTIQVKCETYFDSVVTIPIVNTTYPVMVAVDSMILDSVIGLPNGITWVKNPDKLMGGQTGCLTFTGTTNDPTGNYRLAWYGTVWATLPNPVPANFAKQVYTGILNKDPWYNYHLHVINQGDLCTAISDITTTSSDLSNFVSVYPNPTDGIINLNINAESEISGEIYLTDVTGRILYSRNFDASLKLKTAIDASTFSRGIYFIRIISTKGFAVKIINVE